MNKRHLFALALTVLLLAPVVVFAQGAQLKAGLEGAKTAAGFTGCSDTACLTGIIGKAIGAVIALLGTVLLILMLYGGFSYMTATSPDDVKKAKSILANAIIGMVIIALSFAISNYILSTLSESVGSSTGTAAGTGTSATTPAGARCTCTACTGSPALTPTLSNPNYADASTCSGQCSFICQAQCTNAAHTGGGGTCS